jgi:hypothetical protein
VDPDSIVELPATIDLPVLPAADGSDFDAFVSRVNASGRKWVILTDLSGKPQLLLDSDAYLRAAVIDKRPVDGYTFCHRPIVIEDANRPIGEVISDLRKGISPDSDEAIAKDIVLLWTAEHKRVVTGADILGRLLRGIG